MSERVEIAITSEGLTARLSFEVALPASSPACERLGLSSASEDMPGAALAEAMGPVFPAMLALLSEAHLQMYTATLERLVRVQREAVAG